ncbi:hypothetical protein NicSoilC5_38410 [Arthrobacter sp. NicSoilC5]|nr:hypothetical protein NicSoilC5_38410 [Arthrobacter sp. NicSoilC5]
MSADDLSKVIQSALAATAGLGFGVTLFLSVRRQRTTEDAQATAEKNYGETLNLVRLQVEQQRSAELTALRTRYKDAAEQMGSTAVAVQVAGVYAMAFLADEWEVPARTRERQMSIDVLTSSFPSDRDADTRQALSVENPLTAGGLTKAIWKSIFQRAYSNNTFGQRWTGADVDLRRKNFADIDLPRSLSHRTFDFGSLHFGESTISSLTFNDCEFRDGKISFAKTQILGELKFVGCTFSGGELDLSVCLGAEKLAWSITFVECEFSGTGITFNGIGTSDSGVLFHDCTFLPSAKVLTGLPDCGSFDFDECQFHDKERVLQDLAPMRTKLSFSREKPPSLTAYRVEDLAAELWGSGPIAQ